MTLLGWGRGALPAVAAFLVAGAWGFPFSLGGGLGWW